VGLPPGVGYVLACAAACALGIWLVRRRLGTLLVDTFQLQPYGSM
jgi:ABC-type nitrate/sulfonate/bicarbonate transport system permease component